MAIEIPTIAATQTISTLSSILSNESINMGKRYRALFQLKSIGTEEAIKALQNALSTDSILLKHEIYYCLGQWQHPTALQVLLESVEEQPMARHEQMEALGCYSGDSVVAKLMAGLSDEHKVVRDTCQIALDQLQNNSKPNTTFNSIDPTDALDESDILALERILLDPTVRLHKRYQAMFALRNMQSEHAVNVLSKGFQDDSDLFRHEIAFVFGQMRHLKSVAVLKKVLQDTSEKTMVRHECAEALGSIATKECQEILKEYSNDSDPVVRESCVVGLDMIEYENSMEFIPAKDTARGFAGKIEITSI